MGEYVDLERYYCEYVFLGLPKRPLASLSRFVVKKRLRPTLFCSHAPFIIKLLGVANVRERSCLERDGLAIEILLRHAHARGAKKTVLIPSEEFKPFTERNAAVLGRTFLLSDPEDIY